VAARSSSDRDVPPAKLRWLPLLPAEDTATGRDYTMRTEVWRWKGGTWHFANVPKKQSAEIRSRFGTTARGFGSIRVRVTIGDTQWDTSLFPDRKSGTYLLPIKAAARKAEGIAAGDRITAQVHIL
jgi:hypothetical protein